jgi:hypothetical protein
VKHLIVLPLGLLLLGACAEPPPVVDETEPAPLPHRTEDGGPTAEAGDPDVPFDPVPSCTDACDNKAEGATECSVVQGGSFRICARAEDGCLAWKLTPCTNGVKACSDAPRLCAGGCATSSCTLGETSCTGTDQSVCTLASDGCPAPSTPAACAVANERCIGTHCATACTSSCPALGARRCSSGSSAYQECQAVAGFPSCLQWTNSKSCGGVDYACQGAGQCVKTCTNDCTTSACRSNAYYECKPIGACNKYVLQDNCPAHDAYCGPAPGGEVACKACNSTCQTAGSFQCTGNTSYITCRAATNGCKTQVTGSCNNCFANGKVGCGVN